MRDIMSSPPRGPRGMQPGREMTLSTFVTAFAHTLFPSADPVPSAGAGDAVDPRAEPQQRHDICGATAWLPAPAACCPSR